MFLIALRPNNMMVNYSTNQFEDLDLRNSVVLSVRSSVIFTKHHKDYRHNSSNRFTN